MLEVFAQAEFAEQTKGLPGTIEEAVPYYEGIIDRYDAAVLAGNVPLMRRIEEEADLLATHLNGGEHCGITSGPESPGRILEQRTAAPPGTVPRWGQAGNFTVTLQHCQVRVEFGGLYGICLPQFGAYAVDLDKPFISQTGYRSFMAYNTHHQPGTTVNEYIHTVLHDYITKELKNKLVPIQEEYRERARKR